MKKDIKVFFGEKIKSIRKNRGLSQEEFAKITNLHRTYISDVERGLKNISLENIEKLSIGLGLTISELFFNETDYE